MKILDIIRTSLLGVLVLLVIVGVVGVFSINGHLKKIETSASATALSTYAVSEAPIMKIELIRKNSWDGSQTTWSLPVGSWPWDGN
jgi:hypothetical protein